LFSRVFNHLSISKNHSKIKFLEKFQNFFIKFLRLKWGREALGTNQGDPPCHHTTWWRGLGLAAPWHGVEPPGAPLIPPPAISLSLPKKHRTIAQTHVLAVLARDF
jgi:hypothetical protein